MKKLVSALLTTAVSAAMIASSATAAFAADNLTLGTGGTTGTYYAIGGVMATVLNPVLENSQLTVTSTGASKANIQMIDDGDADLLQCRMTLCITHTQARICLSPKVRMIHLPL